jgi:hypothetical protein
VDLIKVRARHRGLAAYALERKADGLQESHCCLLMFRAASHLVNSLSPGAARPAPRSRGDNV